MMGDKCDKHDEIMGRSFEKINDIEIKVESINAKMDAIIEFKNLMHSAIFGNGHPGIKGKVDSLMSNVA